MPNQIRIDVLNLPIRQWANQAASKNTPNSVEAGVLKARHDIALNAIRNLR